MATRFLLITLISLLFHLGLDAQRLDLNFKHITPKEGLSHSTVTCILRDSKGFMWFGTENGLNKYDGYKITVYKNDRNNPKSLNNNRVSGILEDRDGIIWITTLDGGLNKYNREFDTFTHYVHDINNDETISSNGLLSIFEDHKGGIWIGSYWGLNLFDKKTGIFTRYYHDDTNPNSLKGNAVNKVYEDSKGRLWLGTLNHGLQLFDREKQIYTYFGNEPSVNNSISNNSVKCIFEDSKGRVWIGTEAGLNLLNADNKTFTRFTDQSPEHIRLKHNLVTAITEDAVGKIWIGTGTGGVNILEKNLSKVSYVEIYESDPKSMNSVSICTFLKDKNNNMWIGTTYGGVNWLDWQEKKFKHFKKNILDESSLGNDYVASFAQDHNDVIWVSTGRGLDIFNPANSNFFHYSNQFKNNTTASGSYFSATTMMVDKENYLWLCPWGLGVTIIAPDRTRYERLVYDENNPEGISSNYIKSFVEDTKGNVWIGTSGSGLCVYNKKTKKFRYYESTGSDPNSLSSNYVGVLFIDSRDNIWVGTEGGGLNLFDKKNDNFIRFIPENDILESISSSLIISIFEDSKKRLWIGTFAGLNQYNYESKNFTIFDEKMGLAGNSIKSIQEDNKGNLWLSTNNGIVKFNPETNTFRNYSPEDGLQGLEFNSTSLKSKTGEIYFSSANGFNMFHPDSIKENTIVPQVSLTNFQIFNKEVIIGEEGSPLKKTISETKEINLSYLHSVFSIEYAAQSYSSSAKNQYAYKMEGFEKDWNYVGNKRNATYTNLDPGKYTFRVKASNNDGIWNEEETALALVITPPFWKTWWFRIFTVIFLIGSAFTWYKRRINKINKQKEILESQVKERTSELLEANGTLSEQKEEIFAQRDKLELLYTDIKDSIRAAEGLQHSILPSPCYIQQHLPESFILFKPKDVVSGDFYWFNIKEEKIIIAAVDCTGHGVSGAIMSINGYHLLNQSLLSLRTLSASGILNQLNEGIIKERMQDTDNDVQDGMDIALCIIDKNNKKLQYAGAVNPLYILRNGEIIQIKADGFPIGLTMNGLENNMIRKYKNHEIDLIEGDIVYMFSDGYADQIGGDNGNKKFMYPQFRELLINIGNKSMEQQLASLDDSIEQWKGENEQLDDILVIGFKI